MKIKGLIAATFAAFNEDGSLNFDIIPSLVEKLLADGVSGVFICGTNGEGPNLTIEERMAVSEAYVKAVNKRMLVMIHVGHTSIAESRKLAEHAYQIGADCISSVAAFYFKPSSVENLVSCMADIASAAPLMPFYYYHIPTLTGVGMNMVDFLKLSDNMIPNLAGIKYTASTIHEYQACLNYKNGKYDILFGFDELLLSALAVGAKGAIGSTYTFAAPLYKKIVQHYEAGRRELAQKAQLDSVKMVGCLTRFSPIPAQRAIMKMIGFDLGSCRLPLKELSKSDELTLKASLEEINFFDQLEKYRMQLIEQEI